MNTTPTDWPEFGHMVGRVITTWTDPHQVNPDAQQRLRQDWPAMADALDDLQTLVSRDAMLHYFRNRALEIPDPGTGKWCEAHDCHMDDPSHRYLLTCDDRLRDATATERAVQGVHARIARQRIGA